MGMHKMSTDENESPSKSWKDDSSKLSLSQKEEGLFHQIRLLSLISHLDESTNVSNVLGNPEIRVLTLFPNNVYPN